ncbi:MAG: N-formylglutamate amidohydrolase, partial [Aestuariivirgaceae bacterium]
MASHAKPQDYPEAFLGNADPDPVEVANPDGRSPFVITCEHAGRTTPARLGDLGLDDRHLRRHIAWDIGVEGVGRALAKLLDAPVFFQRYSRLVIDCNRPTWAEDSIPEVSDGTKVPANISLTNEERRARYSHIHEPFHDAVADCIDQRLAQGRTTALIALHSFTPRLEA